ncbi:MAG: L-threonylcarbamoyladenylate synthase [Nonlabens sp.]
MRYSDRKKNRRDQVRGKKPKNQEPKIDLPLEEINKAVDALKKGGTLIYPTDTIYGLGCDAYNYDAVEKIYDIKERDKSKSLIVLVESFNMLESVIDDIPDMAWEVLKVNKKPLTIIYDKPKNIAENIIAQDGSLAVRVTNDPLCRSIIRKLKRPLVSTSANLSGDPSPVNFEDISEVLIDKVDHVMNIPLVHKEIKASTIMKISNNGVFKIIRK